MAKNHGKLSGKFLLESARSSLMNNAWHVKVRAKEVNSIWTQVFLCFTGWKQTMYTRAKICELSKQNQVTFGLVYILLIVCYLGQ